MDYDFRDIMQKILEIYKDDLIVYSKKKEDHLCHFRWVFERCRKYGISLIPKKSIFGVLETKLLSHITCKDEVKIDLERVQGIKEIALPRNLKGLQSFFENINFIHRFIPNFVEITNPLNKLLKKDVVFKWEKDAF